MCSVDMWASKRRHLVLPEPAQTGPCHSLPTHGQAGSSMSSRRSVSELRGKVGSLWCKQETCCPARTLFCNVVPTLLHAKKKKEKEEGTVALGSLFDKDSIQAAKELPPGWIEHPTLSSPADQ